MMNNDYGPQVWPFGLLAVTLLVLATIFGLTQSNSSTYEQGRKLKCSEIQDWVTCPVAFKDDSGGLFYENKWFRRDQLGTVKSIEDGFFDTKIVTIDNGKRRFPIQVGKGNLIKTLDLFKDKGNK